MLRCVRLASSFAEVWAPRTRRMPSANSPISSVASTAWIPRPGGSRWPHCVSATWALSRIRHPRRFGGRLTSSPASSRTGPAAPMSPTGRSSHRTLPPGSPAMNLAGPRSTCIWSAFGPSWIWPLLTDWSSRIQPVLRPSSARRRRSPCACPPTSEEFQRIVADIRSQEYNADAEGSADFIEFLGLAGLGQAEAGSLRWCDIDWEAEQVSTFRHKTQSRFYFPLYPQLRPLLESRKARCETTTDQPVFRIKDAKKALSASCKRLELPPSARDRCAACLSPGPFKKAWLPRQFQNGRGIRMAGS